MLVLVGSSRCEYCVLAEDALDYWNIDYEYTPYVQFPQFKEDGHQTVPQLYWVDDNGAKLLVEGGYNGLISLGETELRKKIKELQDG